MQHRGWKHFGSRWSHPNPIRSFDQPILPRRARQRRAILFTSGVLISALLGWFVFSSRWMIQSVDVESPQGAFSTETIERALEEQLVSKRWGIVPQSHRLFFNEAEARERINRHIVAETITMEWTPERSLRVLLQKPPRGLLLRHEETIMAVDEQGRIFETLPQDAIASHDTVIDVPAALPLGASSVRPEEVQWYRHLPQTVQSLLRVKLKGIRFDEERPKTLVLTLEKETAITLDRETNPEGQLERLRLFLASSKRTLNQLRAVDLRFGATIFYQ